MRDVCDLGIGSGEGEGGTVAVTAAVTVDVRMLVLVMTPRVGDWFRWKVVTTADAAAEWMGTAELAVAVQ